MPRKIDKINVNGKKELIRIEPVKNKKMKLVGKKSKPTLINPLVRNVKR
jgi:hypothetical protein